jgi:pre-mRNA-processing factor 39
MHQYTRYFERLRTLALSRPLSEIVPPDTLARFRLEVQNEAAAASGPARSELEIERDIRTKVDGLYIDIYGVTNIEVQKRWLYESEVKRPYFHVTELESAQITNWHKYLDFEESEGEYARIVALYERCLVSCALYDEFWFRYVRWMDAQPGKDEETRHIYMRAAILVPISRPGIRLQWALFEESRGRVDIAADIHAAILLKLPDCVEVLVSWGNLQRRQNGVEAALQVYRDHIDAPTVDLYTKAALVGESAHLLWRFQGSVEEARTLFLKNVQWYADSRAFWDKWFQFELDQPFTPATETDHAARVKHVFDEFVSRTRLSTETKREFAQIYLQYLIQRGGKEAMKVFLEVDRGMFGPPSVATLTKVGSAAKENGAGRPELDEAQRKKAEGGYVNFFELHKEPTMETQGTTSFH